MDKSEQDDYAGGGASVPEEMNLADTGGLYEVQKSKRGEDIEWVVPVPLSAPCSGVRKGRDFMPRLPGQNIIIVKPRDSATPTYSNNLNILDLTSENEEEIPEEKAVCKFCFKTFETENMLKAKCMCPTALAHEACIVSWSGAKGNNECDVCEQEVQSFSVDWHLGVSNQLQKPSKRGWISRLKRVCSCCF